MHHHAKSHKISKAVYGMKEARSKNIYCMNPLIQYVLFEFKAWQNKCVVIKIRVVTSKTINYFTQEVKDLFKKQTKILDFN